MPYRIQPSKGLLESGPLRPLLALVALTFGTLAIEPMHTNWLVVGGAAGFAAALVLVASTVPWHRLPASALVVPAIGTLVMVAILRHSQGGAASGYSPVVVLPVVWIALTVGRRAVLVVSLGVTAMLALPIVIYGAPMYPSSAWRSTLLLTVASVCAGLVVAAVSAEQRAHAASAGWQTDQVAETLAALEAVAAVARDISSGADARERVCATAFASTGATMVTLIERHAGAFTLTGAAGIPIELAVLKDAVQPSASLAAFFSQERVLIPDVSTNAGVSPLIIQATGLVSIAFEPIIHRGQPIGVLAVGWATRKDTLEPKIQAVISFLAAEAGSAFERSDLLDRLDRQARTDELTSVPNRRAWDDAIAEAVAREGRVCVAMLDIDHFKAYNDDHGHVAGDILLERCARAWSAHLRPGDLLARYGGEEFAVLVRGCSIAEARAVLERLRQATPGDITCSLGVAARRPSDSVDDLIARADGALYDAKRAGRDQLAAA